MNFKKFFYSYNRDGLVGFCNILLGKLGFKFRLKTGIDKRLKFLINDLMFQTNCIVQSGIYTGMKLSKDKLWSASQYDYGSKLLGIYEIEVQEKLKELKFKYFINLGCAEGYHLVGQLLSKPHLAKLLAFDKDLNFQNIINDTINLNSLDHKIKFYGAVNKHTVNNILNEGVDLSKACFLIDIEGYEFIFLNDKTIFELKKSLLIIEIHQDKNNSKYKNLINKLQQFFKVEIITTGTRDMSKFKLLRGYSDIDRWILANEARPQLMEWFICYPRK